MTSVQMNVCDIRQTPGSHYDIIEEGPFSTVSKTWLKIEEGRPQWVVVKAASTYRKFSKEPHDIVKEFELLSSMTHPNIVKTIGGFLDEEQMLMNIYMPWFPTSLSQLLASPFFSPHPFPPLRVPDDTLGPLYECQFVMIAKSIMVQVLAAVAFLHDPLRQVAHRDIKPENIMLTKDGCVKLIDFGVSWKEQESDSAKEHYIWPEYKGDLYFEVSTGGYRAPELLFGTRSYNPLAIDLWSLGATFAEFFTALRLVSDDEDDGDDDDDTEPEPDVYSADLPPPPFIIPKYLRIGYPGAQWTRESLFNGDRGEIGLAWSIFKIIGTPTAETWPEFDDFPTAKSVVFNMVPAVPLIPLLPNLPPSTLATCVRTSSSTKGSSEPGCSIEDQPLQITTDESMARNPSHKLLPTSPADLISQLLVYPTPRRLQAEDALRHPWVSSPDSVLLLPKGYMLEYGHLKEVSVHEWNDKTLEEWLQNVLTASVPGR